jgi:hypothetical protein
MVSQALKLFGIELQPYLVCPLVDDFEVPLESISGWLISFLTLVSSTNEDTLVDGDTPLAMSAIRDYRAQCRDNPIHNYCLLPVVGVQAN